MRKLLDWIADKLGYERKIDFYGWPINFTLPPITQEIIDDGIIHLQTEKDMTIEILGPFDDGPHPTINATLTKKID